MKDLVAKGWKTENGFKLVYLLKLEAGMLKMLPGIDIRANPHIISRITIWKKNQGSLQTMLNGNSGIGFNTTTSLLQCHDDCWDRIVKAGPNATNMFFKAWTVYDDWNKIFGMDHANGRAVENVEDAANDIRSDNDLDVEDHHDDPLDPAPVKPPPVDMGVASEAPAVDNSTAAKLTGKKRPANDSSNAGRLCDVLGQFCKSSDNRFNSLVQVIGYESGLGGARKELPNVLVGLLELSEDERIKAAHMFAKNADCFEMFLGMSDESRARYVRRLLDGDLKM
ncbi:hypothetical protein ACS0TY_035441 [Phlomoides rotata]